MPGIGEDEGDSYLHILLTKLQLLTTFWLGNESPSPKTNRYYSTQKLHFCKLNQGNDHDMCKNENFPKDIHCHTLCNNKNLEAILDVK